jgi:TolA-binding protein
MDRQRDRQPERRVQPAETHRQGKSAFQDALGRALFVSLTAVLVLLPVRARGQETDAERAFTGAVQLFQGGWYDRAEKELGAFAAAFPSSTNRNEAVLLQAQSRFQLKDHQGVIQLTEQNLAGAGPWTDQFLYWLAQSQAQLERYDAAANTYAQLLKDCPESRLRLEAAYSEALCRYRLGDTARTVELLRSGNGAFQQAAKGSTNAIALVRGSFLLAEALFAQKDFPNAERTLTELAQRGLSPEAEWQRQYLLARIEMSDRRPDAALLRVTNLVTIASNRTNAQLQARSLSLKGEILEQKQPEAAAQTYQAIVALPGIAADQKRQALLKLVDLAVNQGRFTNAILQLTGFLEQNAQDPASDLMRLSLGELYLKQYYSQASERAGTNAAAATVIATNLLQSARVQFDQLAQQFTNSVYVGKALLNRGWCSWEESQLLNDAAWLNEARQAFESAAGRLPKSLDQAEARFKLADCDFQSQDYTNAIGKYKLVLDTYSDLPEAREKLLDHTLYQLLRAGIAAGQWTEAQAAVERLQRDYPASGWADQGVFLYSQALTDAGEFAKAQQFLDEFPRRFPQSPLVPDARLALAKVANRQGDWATAIRRYDEWINQFTNHVSRPQAEFDRAWCYYQSGSDTNAFKSLTNLVHRFPSSPVAPLAQLWIGDYYLNLRNYADAETYYQLPSTSMNPAPVELVKQGLLMSAKAAFFRGGYPDARYYLTNTFPTAQTALIADPQFGAEAWFMLGDIELEDRARTTNKLARSEEAINRFQRVTTFYPNSRLAPLAMGKIANCYFQLAADNSNRYEMATNQYWQVVTNTVLADASTRSQAEYALGRVLEKMADQRTNRVELLQGALGHYLDVVYGRRLGAGDDPDPLWVSQAALAAGALASERLERFDEAERLYEAMLQRMPSLSAIWIKRLETVRQQRPK